MGIKSEKARVALEQRSADQIRHSSGNFLSHLVGVQRILGGWGGSEEVQLAGLFHSVYSTEVFKKTIFSLDERVVVRDLIGERAERLSYLFCAMSRPHFLRCLGGQETPLIRDRFIGREVPISLTDQQDLLHLALANELEQIDRLPWSARLQGLETFLRVENLLSPAALRDFQRLFGLDRNKGKNVLICGSGDVLSQQMPYVFASQGYRVSVLTKSEMTWRSHTRVRAVPFDIHQPLVHHDELDAVNWHFVCVFAPHRHLASIDRRFELLSRLSKIRYGIECFGTRATSSVRTGNDCGFAKIHLPTMIQLDDPHRRLEKLIWKLYTAQTFAARANDPIPPMATVDQVLGFLTWLCENPVSTDVRVRGGGQLTYAEFFDLVSRQVGSAPTVRLSDSVSLSSDAAPKGQSEFQGQESSFVFPNIRDWLPNIIEEVCRPTLDFGQIPFGTSRSNFANISGPE